MNLATVILAGGEGRRIGGGKPLLKLAGETLLDRSLHHARRLPGPFAVAVRDRAQVPGAEARIILDEPSIEGPLAGLAAAFRFGESEAADAILTLPADTPFLPGDLAARLARSLADTSAAIASSGGKLHPVCGLWRVQAARLIGDYIESGGRSLKGFAMATGFRSVDWPAEPFDPFFNINTLDDLVAAEKFLKR